jgi:hypothetical protein
MDKNLLQLSNKIFPRPLAMDPLKTNGELLLFHFLVPLKSRSSLAGMGYHAVTKPKVPIAANLQALQALPALPALSLQSKCSALNS